MKEKDMTSSLFNEALNDAKAIRAAAEERAKQQLLETMSPKLKKIVENTINQQMGLFEEESDDIDLDNLEQELADETESTSSTASSTSQMSEDDDLGEIDLNEEEVEECGQNYSMESDEPYDRKVNESAKEVLNILLTKDVIKRNLQKEVKAFEKEVKLLKNMFVMIENHKVDNKTVKKVDQTLLKLVENSKNIASNDIIKNQTQIKLQFSNALQELNQMTRRRNNILAENYASLARRSRRLFEAEGDEEETDDLSDVPALDDESPEMDDEMDMGADMDSKFEESDPETLERIANQIRQMLNGEGGDEEGMEDIGDEEGMEDMGDEEEEKSPKTEWARRRGRLFAESDDLEEVEDLEEQEYCEDDMPEMQTESDYFFEADRKETAAQKKARLAKEKAAAEKKKNEKKKTTESQRRGGDVFLEIDENMLKREISRMKKLREGDAEDMISHFGGAKSEGEPFLDFDDSDLNGNVDNLGSFPSKGGRLKEGRSYNSNGQTRLLEGKVQNYRKALTGMKNQLSEMTLFNAKLLYANKLMQNRDLTNSQQRHIVESLDQAKNLREAQLLFEGLSKSLTKGTGRSGSLNESASRRIAGGSSRSTSSAQSAQNRIETDRWAILAGIKK